MTDTITIAAAAIINSDEQMLLVRKRGTVAFMQPGGKIEAGETAESALIRELEEELVFRPDEESLNFVGRFHEIAANEPDTTVSAEVFRICHDGPFIPQAEIEEIRWYPSEFGDGDVLAPLTENQIIPASEV